MQQMKALLFPHGVTIRQWSDGQHYLMYDESATVLVRDWLGSLTNELTNEAVTMLHRAKQAEADRLKARQEAALPTIVTRSQELDREIARLSTPGQTHVAPIPAEQQPINLVTSSAHPSVPAPQQTQQYQAQSYPGLRQAQPPTVPHLIVSSKSNQSGEEMAKRPQPAQHSVSPPPPRSGQQAPLPAQPSKSAQGFTGEFGEVTEPPKPPTVVTGGKLTPEQEEEMKARYLQASQHGLPVPADMLPPQPSPPIPEESASAE